MTSYKCITVNGKQVRLHRHLMQQKLGRQLGSNELVHHKDGDKHNNEISNLEITTRGKHMKHHRIGADHRFKQVYHIYEADLVYLYVDQKLPIHQIAFQICASYNSVWRALKKYRIKRNIVCGVCGKKARYITAELCNSCYHKEYHAKHR